MRRFTIVAAALALCSVSTAYGQDSAPAKKLTIGDQAPPLDIAHWIKGDKIHEYESGKVYVVEFWSTGSGSSIAFMPRLSELQEQYTDYDVKFIGVSHEDLQTVVSFLFEKYERDGKIHNDRTRFTLTTDPDRSVMNEYFVAAGYNNIPCAFIIGKDSRVEWIGRPTSMDEPLEAVIKDTWDRDKFKVIFEKELADRLLSRQKRIALQAAITKKDWEGAITVIDELTAMSDTYLRLNSQKFQILTRELKDYDRANALAPGIFEQLWDNANALNNLTWFMVDDAGLENFDAALVLKAAKRANELTEHTSAAYLDTLARVYYESGDVRSALKWQRRAADQLNGDERYTEGVMRYLKKYQQEVDSEI